MRCFACEREIPGLPVVENRLPFCDWCVGAAVAEQLGDGDEIQRGGPLFVHTPPVPIPSKTSMHGDRLAIDAKRRPVSAN